MKPCERFRVWVEEKRKTSPETLMGLGMAIGYGIMVPFFLVASLFLEDISFSSMIPIWSGGGVAVGVSIGIALQGPAAKQHPPNKKIMAVLTGLLILGVLFGVLFWIRASG